MNEELVLKDGVCAVCEERKRVVVDPLVVHHVCKDCLRTLVQGFLETGLPDAALYAHVTRAIASQRGIDLDAGARQRSYGAIVHGPDGTKRYLPQGKCGHAFAGPVCPICGTPFF